jgi:hypothetical protein
LKIASAQSQADFAAASAPPLKRLAKRFEVGCTIEVEHTCDYLHAHVRLDGDLPIGPGDAVRVHGAPIKVAFGARLLERRRATVHRAGWLRRHWTRLAARFALSELYEVSFTSRRVL